MQDFVRSADGRLTDVEVSRAIAQCLAEVPSADESAIEAHMTLWRAQNVYATALAQAYDELGLSIPRFNILRWLYHSPDNQRSMTELGNYLDASAPNVTRMVKSLEAAQWVLRIRGEGDRRLVIVQMTPKGRRDFAELLPRAVNIWGNIWAGMSTEDRTQISNLMTGLRMSLLSRYADREGPEPAASRRQRGSPKQSRREPRS